MSDPGVQANAMRMALVRAATAMLRALGGTEVALMLPLVAFPDDTSAQLGLADPGIDEVRICPVVVRSLSSDAKTTRMRAEFLMPSPVVWSKVESRGMESAQALFDSALGILHENRLLRIEKVESEQFGGSAYLYRVTAGE